MAAKPKNRFFEEKYLNGISLTFCPNSQCFHTHISQNAFYVNCTVGPTPRKKMAARAVDKKYKCILNKSENATPELFAIYIQNGARQ